MPVQGQTSPRGGNFGLVGVLITCSTVCNGEALAASVSEYAAPAPFKARTNSA